MLTRQAILFVLALIFFSLSIKAQTFETRSTRYSGNEILNKLNDSGTPRQFSIRDSTIEKWSASLGPTDIIETFYNDYHMGLVIYRDRKPFQLLGFWNPKGQEINGGSLINGTGEVKTPFNPDSINNFKSESVQYVSGLKNGSCFYYCDCASVLRRGTFTNNKKIGMWEEFTASGVFIKQKNLEVPDPPVDTLLLPPDRDWIAPAHCMMQPDIIICPGSGGGKG